MKQVIIILNIDLLLRFSSLSESHRQDAGRNRLAKKIEPAAIRQDFDDGCAIDLIALADTLPVHNGDSAHLGGEDRGNSESGGAGRRHDRRLGGPGPGRVAKQFGSACQQWAKQQYGRYG
jgi:hypothetical protein